MLTNYLKFCNESKAVKRCVVKTFALYFLKFYDFTTVCVSMSMYGRVMCLCLCPH